LDRSEIKCVAQENLKLNTGNIKDLKSACIIVKIGKSRRRRLLEYLAPMGR
jgi:hypothetical protein